MPGADLTKDTDRAAAAAAIAESEALQIVAGAGMGADWGLPDFRGDEGFWNAYPPFRGRRFAEMSNPAWFARDPAQAWAFFGHRLQPYRETTPLAGFEILLNWARTRVAGWFVFTSHVDGQFQRAGFDADRIVECHGAIARLQSSVPCCRTIWPATDVSIQPDMATIRAAGLLPAASCSAPQASRPSDAWTP